MTGTTAGKTRRVVILGAGFGGLYTTLHLEEQLRPEDGVEIVLVSRENYFLITPLLFEAGSGVLEPRHAVSPIRRLLKRARFVEADVEAVDTGRRVVTVRHEPGTPSVELEYDQLVLALGGVTNTRLIPGSEKGLTFKTLADALFLRNHVIDLFERADVETEAARQRELLTFVIIGGGLVGVELMGELQQFVSAACESYPRVPRERVRFLLVEAMGKILPELEDELGTYAARTLEKRGVEIRVNTKVGRIEEGALWLPPSEGTQGSEGSEGQRVGAATIVVATGVIPNPLLAGVQVQKDPRGKVLVDACMRSLSHPGVWGIGDCAHIPGPDGKPYPPLAQHALREARVLAGNICAALRGEEPRAFVFKTLGTLAALGHFNGVGRIGKIRVKGFVAWWIWRSYYLMQMPRWSRRVRLMLDWTVSLFFRYDVVKMDYRRGA